MRMRNIKQEVYRYLKGCFDYFNDTTFYYSEDKKIKAKCPWGRGSMEHFVNNLKKIYTRDKDTEIKDLYEKNEKYLVRVVYNNFSKMYDTNGVPHAEFERLKKEIDRSLKQVATQTMAEKDPLANLYTIKLISKFRIELKRNVIKYNEKNQFDKVASYYEKKYKDCKKRNKAVPKSREELVNKVINLSGVFIMNDLLGVNEVKEVLNSSIVKLEDYRAKLSPQKLSDSNEENKINIIKIYKRCCKIMNIVQKNTSLLKLAIVKTEFISIEKELKNLCIKQAEKILQKDTEKRKLKEIKKALMRINTQVTLFDNSKYHTVANYRECAQSIGKTLQDLINDLKNIVGDKTFEKDGYYEIFSKMISCCEKFNQEDVINEFNKLGELFDKLWEHSRKDHKINTHVAVYADVIRNKLSSDKQIVK